MLLARSATLFSKSLALSSSWEAIDSTSADVASLSSLSAACCSLRSAMVASAWATRSSDRATRTRKASIFSLSSRNSLPPLASSSLSTASMDASSCFTLSAIWTLRSRSRRISASMLPICRCVLEMSASAASRCLCASWALERTRVSLVRRYVIATSFSCSSWSICL
ncbi:MAG: hypothetical protein A4E31_00383 [Methanomassiliicoccales archaeon PtaU1.Bin030]|nr:MAG: hypothetical protein A4E31_00383 [Methanomassiliicoccales archaeon PtaU1.Bin030]